MTTKLSATMEECLRYIGDEGGGAIERYQGGCWASPGGPHPYNKPRTSWEPSTIKALVTRGRLEFTEWKEGRGGRFPIRAAIPAGAEVET